MPETGNRQEAAERLSKEILAAFGWELLQPTNTDWECATPNHPESTKTHPSDCVFKYTDPYSGNAVLIQSDLKNYAAESINVSKLTPYIASLARATDCARRSDSWQKRFAPTDEQWDVTGLLFVFNNSGDYTQNLEEKLAAAGDDAFGIPARTRLFVASPQRIRYWATIAADIRQRRGDGELPPPESCHFHYPHLINQKASHPLSRSATIESLMGPWIAMRHQLPQSEQPDFSVYINPRALTREYFHYLIDSLLRHQLVTDSKQRILVRGVASLDAEAKTLFARAREEYWRLIPGGNTNLRALVEAIEYRSINLHIPRFNIEELGFSE